MTFETPTTKEQMYNVLQQIYHYYRIQREGYVGSELEDLEIERINFTPLSDEELSIKAGILLSAKKQREISEYESKINQEIAIINVKINALNEEKQSAIDEVNNLYIESEKKIEEQAVKNGLLNSSIVVDKITQLETAKNSKIAELNTYYLEKISSLNASMAEQEIKKSQAETLYNEIYLKEEKAKAVELKDEQEKLRTSIFKYNNSLHEKEVKYRNSIAQQNLEFKLKFMEIQSSEYTKEELVDMGYYEDAIDCICAYYNTLQPLQAYQDIVEEERLMIFLDDYYQNLLYMYKLRATN